MSATHDGERVAMRASLSLADLALIYAENTKLQDVSTFEPVRLRMRQVVFVISSPLVGLFSFLALPSFVMSELNEYSLSAPMYVS